MWIVVLNFHIIIIIIIIIIIVHLETLYIHVVLTTISQHLQINKVT